MAIDITQHDAPLVRHRLVVPVRHLPSQHREGRIDAVAGHATADRSAHFVAVTALGEINVVPNVGHIVIAAKSRQHPRILRLHRNRTGKNGVGRPRLVRLFGVGSAGVFPDVRLEQLRHPHQVVAQCMIPTPGPPPVAAERNPVVVLGNVHRHGQADLFAVVQAGRLAGLGLRLGQSRQQQPGEYRDNGDHHQQLDQRKGLGQAGRIRRG